MADITQLLLEVGNFVLGLLILAVPLTVGVLAFSRLEAYFGKKLKLSWIKASMLSTFAAVFILALALYALPLTQVKEAGVSILPEGAGTEISDIGGTFVEQPINGIPLVDFLISGIFSTARLLFIAFIIALLLLPLELLASAVFSKLAKKNSSNILAFYAATFTALLTAMIILMLFPWIPAGIIYFIYFS